MTIKCPKCYASMHSISFQTIQVQRCSECHSLWFETDALSQKHLRTFEETQSPSSTLLPYCPTHGKQMTPVVMVESPQINFSCCTKCNASFFDAAAISDYKKMPVRDFFGTLLIDQD